MRAAIPALLAVGLVVSLAACSSPGSTDPDATGAAGDCKPVASGSISDGVKAAGDFSSKPTVTFSFPLTVEAEERTVLIKGDGDQVVSGDTALIEYTLINGKTGEELGSSSYTEGAGTSLAIGGSATAGDAVFASVVECAAIGSRVVGVFPAADLGAEFPVVFVADVIGVKAPLESVDYKDAKGFPEVVFGEDGAPTVTIPASDPPATLSLAIIEEGDGDVVAAGSNVTVNYQGTNWTTKEVFDDSWPRGEPSTFNTQQVVTGFGDALVGQKVGTKLIVIVPPADGYGSAGRAPSIGGTDTIVFVVEIVSVAK